MVTFFRHGNEGRLRSDGRCACHAMVGLKNATASHPFVC